MAAGLMNRIPSRSVVCAVEQMTRTILENAKKPL